jgi:hypothetical protein
MDAYGHLLPGAEADEADKLGAMVETSLLQVAHDENEIVLRTTGTDGPGEAQRQAQQLERESGQRRATQRNESCGRWPGADSQRVSKHSANAGPSAPLEHSVRRGTIAGLPTAPLAQLAEQLTLNQ